MNYWKECIAEALEDAGLSATEQQIKTVAEWVEGAHDNYSMAHGHDMISNPLLSENKELAKKLAIEKSKTVCRECNGHGRLEFQGPHHCSNTECHKCHGAGKVVA